MKVIWGLLGAMTVVILIHGTITYRRNYQIAFAQAVERKIAVESIHVNAVSGVLVLSGRASKEQADYAEGVARTFLTKYAAKTVNPPSDIRNEIEIGNVVGSLPSTDQRAPAASN